MAQTTAAVRGHLPIQGVTTLVMGYLAAPCADIQDAYCAEFWELCDELTTADNANNALRFACIVGNEGLVRLTIDRGAYAFSASIAVAATHGHLGVVHIMLKQPIVRIAQAVTQAATYGHLSIVQALLDNRDNGTRAIDWDKSIEAACHNNHVEIARALLALHDPSPLRWRTIISNASRHGHNDLIRACLEHGAYPHMSSELLRTCMRIAKSHGRESTTVLLGRIRLNRLLIPYGDVAADYIRA
jgi:ankyrin repeat protein